MSSAITVPQAGSSNGKCLFPLEGQAQSFDQTRNARNGMETSLFM